MTNYPEIRVLNYKVLLRLLKASGRDFDCERSSKAHQSPRRRTASGGSRRHRAEGIIKN